MTTVHDLQIVEDAPVEEHDFSVDFIATPTRMVKLGVYAAGRGESSGRISRRKDWMKYPF